MWQLSPLLQIDSATSDLKGTDGCSCCRTRAHAMPSSQGSPGRVSNTEPCGFTVTPVQASQMNAWQKQVPAFDNHISMHKPAEVQGNSAKLTLKESLDKLKEVRASATGASSSKTPTKRPASKKTAMPSKASKPPNKKAAKKQAEAQSQRAQIEATSFMSSSARGSQWQEV